VGSRGVTSERGNGSSKGGANVPKHTLQEARVSILLRCGVSQVPWEMCAGGSGLLLKEM